MMKYNVKKIENTNTMTTTLTTSCKKRDTAISRFCRFLSEYDSYFKDSLLIATAKIYYAGDAECCVYKADIDTDEYIMTYTEYTPMSENTNNNVVFTLIIEFKHDENTTTYKSLANTSVSNNTNDNNTSTDSADGNKTPAELKAEINKKYGVNAVYYDTDSVLCDAEKQGVYVTHDKATNNEVYATSTKIIVRDVCENDEVCTITPYENGKELTTPIPTMKCLTNVIDYVTRLYDMNVVTRETYFTISRIGKVNVVLTYTNTHNIVQYYNISAQMQTLATTAIEQYGYYSKYTRKPLKLRQYDTLELYKNNIYLTISQCNDSENAVRNFWCNIIYKDVNHIGQYTYKELLHMIDNIRFNTQAYCDKYFD